MAEREGFEPVNNVNDREQYSTVGNGYRLKFQCVEPKTLANTRVRKIHTIVRSAPNVPLKREQAKRRWVAAFSSLDRCVMSTSRKYSLRSSGLYHKQPKMETLCNDLQGIIIPF